MVGVGLPLQEGRVDGGCGCAPPRGLPPKFSICNLSSVSCASSGLRPLPPCMPPLPPCMPPNPQRLNWAGLRLFPCLEPSLLPRLLKALPYPGRPSLAFPLAGPVPTHRPCDASPSSHPALCRHPFPTREFSPQLGGWNRPSSRLPHNRCLVNKLCLKLGDQEIQRTCCVP